MSEKTADLQYAERDLKAAMVLYYLCAIDEGLDIDDIETRLIEIISSATNNRLELSR